MPTEPPDRPWTGWGRNLGSILAAGLSVMLVASSCTDSPRDDSSAGSDQVAEAGDESGAADPEPLPSGAERVVGRFVDQVSARIYDPVNGIDPEVVEQLGDLDDARLAWLVADGLRFVGRGPELDALVASGSRLAGIELRNETAWLTLNNHLLSIDMEAPPGYRDWKRELYIAVDATWSPFFNDPEADVDWRQITFGGVLADRRSFGSQDSCQCIAALDDPPSIPAAEVDWLNDLDMVIGVRLGEATRAYPLHILETHELVNDALDGERITLAYCTLCGSAQAYRLDDLPARFQPAVLRTSGLLNRSNKIMFDLDSRSMVDTFTGRATTGPWREAGIVLDQISTVISTWGAWRSDHPETTLMAGLNGTGPDYPLDPLGGRDDGAPIFPVGEVDPRLFPQTDVIGVVTDDGRAIAFPTVEARSALRDGRTVSIEGVRLVLDGSGLRALGRGDEALVAHQAFWFAWSQFNPNTTLWSP